MKYPSSSKSKKTMAFAAAGVAACVFAAAVVYAGLRMILPNTTRSKVPLYGTTIPPSKDQLAKEADKLFQSGDDALKVGDAKKGIAELTRALKLYEQTGDVMQIEAIKDQIALAEQAIKVEKGYESAQNPEDKAKTSNTP